MASQCTFSNFQDIQVLHTALEWVVDFDELRIKGKARLDFRVLTDSVKRVVLDTHNLEISAVVGVGEVTVIHWLTGVNTDLGAPITIDLQAPLTKGANFSLSFEYATASSPSGLSWFPAALSGDEKFPFLFSQFEPTHARSAFPCQDVPAIKFPYSASVVISPPLPLTVLMSAQAVAERPAALDRPVYDEPSVAFEASASPILSSTPAEAPAPPPVGAAAATVARAAGIDVAAAAADGIVLEEARGAAAGAGETLYFEQRVPVPSYLVAIIAGAVGAVDFGHRVRIFATPPMLQRVQRELQGCDVLLDAAEAMFGRYVWGRGDMVFVPSAFSYGGMENPSIITLHASGLCGDWSTLTLPAHELAHSWFGNLVTNASWDSFFLNEGFTMWAERKLIALFRGLMLAGSSTHDALRARAATGRPLAVHVGARTAPAVEDFGGADAAARAAVSDDIERKGPATAATWAPEQPLHDCFARAGDANIDDAIAMYGSAEHEYTKLRPCFARAAHAVRGLVEEGPPGHPDDAFSPIPYEKGYQFVAHLERLCGEWAFAEWVRTRYLPRFAGRSVTVEAFMDAFTAEFPAQAAVVDVAAWLDAPGRPPVPYLTVSDASMDEAVAPVTAWWTGNAAALAAAPLPAATAAGVPPAPAATPAEWATPQWAGFLGGLIKAPAVPWCTPLRLLAALPVPLSRYEVSVMLLELAIARGTLDVVIAEYVAERAPSDSATALVAATRAAAAPALLGEGAAAGVAALRARLVDHLTQGRGRFNRPIYAAVAARPALASVSCLHFP